MICLSFIQLSPEEQLFLMMNNNSNSIHNIFTIMNDDPLIGQILKLTITGLSIGLYKEEYIIKCIETSYLINKEISICIIEEYLNHNGVDIISNNKLITYFLKFFMLHLKNNSIMDKMSDLIEIKLSSIMFYIKNFSLNNMEYAYEIYKLGKIIIDSEVIYVNGNNYRILAKIKSLTNNELEYIVKSIHTCLINKNYVQAQTILAIIFYFDNDLIGKFLEYYNKWLLIRIGSSKALDDILSIEYNLWNINKQYKAIINCGMFSNYLQIINNIKYTIIINNDLSEIVIKNSNIIMNKVKIKLELNITNNDYQDFIHHEKINSYLSGLNKYFNIKTPLQTIEHDMKKSKITLKSDFGKINCTLILGSILMHLNDNDNTLLELSKLMNIKEEKLNKLLNVLIINNSNQLKQPHFIG
jgi:hypothetical protein